MRRRLSSLVCSKQEAIAMHLHGKGIRIRIKGEEGQATTTEKQK